MPNRIITEHKNNLQSTHLYTELSSFLTKNIQTELKTRKTDTDKKDIIKTINKYANKTTVSDTQSDERILSILPYVKGTTDRIGRILNKHNILSINHPKRKDKS